MSTDCTSISVEVPLSPLALIKVYHHPIYPSAECIQMESSVCVSQLEVEDPSQRKMKLGSLLLGQKVKKQVALVNRSPSDISFSLLLNTHTPLDPRVGNTRTHTGIHTSHTYTLLYISILFLSSSRICRSVQRVN